MNKLMGFYELKASSLPTIQWEEYNSDSLLNGNILWTVRTAVHRGSDINLPRAIGVTAKEAKEFAIKTSHQLGNNGMVLYYPYFLAEKSGTLNVFGDYFVIEAVKGDLWNLVTYSCKDVTVIQKENSIEFVGDSNFLCSYEYEELISHVKTVRQMFRDELIEGNSVLLEWSFAYNCNLKKSKIGERYLVFYEARTV